MCFLTKQSAVLATECAALPQQCAVLPLPTQYAVLPILCGVLFDISLLFLRYISSTNSAQVVTGGFYIYPASPMS